MNLQVCLSQTRLSLEFLSMALTLSSISLIFTIMFFAYKFFCKLRYNLPPGPYPLPIIGNLHNMEPDMSQCLDKWLRIYGHIVSFQFCSTLNVIVSTSQLAKEVLKDKDLQLANRDRNKIIAIMSKNGRGVVWADYGPRYVKLRKICFLELFSPKIMEALRPIREDEVRSMVSSVFKVSIDCNNGGKSVVLRKYLQEVVLNNVTMLVLGNRFMTKDCVTSEEGLEFKAIMAEDTKLATSLFPAEHIWWLSWIFWLKGRAFSEHLARRDQFIQAIVEDHNAGNANPCLLDALLSKREVYELSEDDIRGLIWDVLVSGVETSVVAVEYAIAQLVKNPKVQNKAQEELDRVIGRNRVMTEPDISNLPYLQCVVKETLRLHPPAPLMLPHMANANIKIGGYDVPKGTNVYVNVKAIGCDPAIWQDPLEFRPERFLEQDVDFKGHDFRLLPFGAGRRMCPAMQFAANLVTSVIGHLLHHFIWVPPEGVQAEQIDMSASTGVATLMKIPLQAVPTMRLPLQLYNYEAMDV